MERRGFLAGVAAAAGGVAGCLDASSRPRGQAGGPATGSPPASPTDGAGLGPHGYPPTICEQEIVEDFGIRAVVEPAFATDWSGHDVPGDYTLGDASGLVDEAVVVGLTAGSRSRAYPVSVLWMHEIVNDDFGRPLIVTFCPLCASGLVAERLVDGEPTLFGVSGQLWDPPEIALRGSVREGRAFAATRWNASADVTVRDSGNLVMFDEATESFWSQVLGEAICGPLAGDTLPLVPSTLASWGEWRRRHPDTEVLLPPPHSTLMG